MLRCQREVNSVPQANHFTFYSKRLISRVLIGRKLWSMRVQTMENCFLSVKILFATFFLDIIHIGH